MSRRITFDRIGGPEVLSMSTFTPKQPQADEVLVSNRAIGFNFIDTYYRTGLYPVKQWPSGLGSEGAGIVEAVGDAVTRFSPGDRVAYASASLGAYSDHHLVPEAMLVKLPDELTFEQAAAVLLKGLTVQYLLRQTYRVQRGETILFHAAAGGVGSIACQWARALGVNLIGTVGSDEKAAQAKANGAWATLNYRHEPVAERVAELTDGRLCPVVYDSVGRDTWLTSLDCLQRRGLMVSFGNASGPVTGVDLGILNRKGSLFVTRPSLGGYADTPEALQAMSDELFAMVAAGDIQADPAHRFSLEEAGEAQTLLAARALSGLTILVP